MKKEPPVREALLLLSKSVILYEIILLRTV